MRALLQRHGLTLLLSSTLAGPARAQTTTPVVDGHTHQGLTARGGALQTSGLADLDSRGLQVVVHAVPVDRTPTPDLLERLVREMDWLRRTSRTDPGFTLAEEPGLLLSRPPGGGTQVLFSLEWFGELFGSDVDRVKRYRDLGVRVVGLVDDDPDGLFESARLSPFGRRIVAALNEAGILIDITHLSHERMLAVISQSQVPVVASHANAQAATPTRRNLSDGVVTALASTNGSVWVSFNRREVLGDAAGEDEGVDRLIDHIDALVARLGPDHVGIGTDLQADGRYVPAPLNRQDAFSVIRQRLRERGYSAREVDGILGGNVLKALVDASR